MKKTYAKCPNCGQHISRADLIKEWNATPKAQEGQIRVTIHLWKCPSCKKKFRTATRVWLKPKGTLQKLKDAVTPKKPEQQVDADRGSTLK